MAEIVFFYIFIFFCGLFFGSFLNVVIDRLPFGKSIIFPSSHCPHCKHKLAIIDLIPIFSFIYLGKRCRYCNKNISWYYPVVEIITGILFVLTTYIIFGTNIVHILTSVSQLWLILYTLFLISIFILVFFIDLKYGIIPFKLVLLTFIVVSIRYLFIYSSDLFNIVNYFISGIGIFLVFFLIFFLSRGKALGFGDVVFSFLMGYILGFPNIVLGVYIAFLTGAMVSLILVLANKKKLRGGTIPFGPFLAFAMIVSIFWGDLIVGIVLKYLHVY